MFIAEKAWNNVKSSLKTKLAECFELISEGIDIQEVAEKCNMQYNTACVNKKRIINKISREIVRLEKEFG